MYGEQTCKERDVKLEEIQEATVRSIHEANQRSFMQALSIAWDAGWQACLDHHYAPGTVLKDTDKK